MDNDDHDSEHASRTPKDYPPTRERESYVDFLLGQLADLERRAHVINGVIADEDQLASDTDRDVTVGINQLAYDALRQTGALTRAVARWALDHKIGLAKAGLLHLPLASVAMMKKPDYQAERSKVDDRAHEVAGHDFNPEDLADPILARRMLINLLLPNPAGLPSKLNSMLVEGLQALDEGKTLPLLKATKGPGKARMRDEDLKIKALAHVDYRRALGMTEEYAEEIVSNSYGIDIETIRSWRKRLRNNRGRLSIDLSCSRGHEAARWDMLGSMADNDSSRISGAMEYGDDALEADGTRYRQNNRRLISHAKD